MGLKAGSVNDFADSMVAAMEQALKDQWTAMGRGTLGDVGAEDRRLMFAAIARGMLKYLKSKEAAGIHLYKDVTFDMPHPTPDETRTVKGLTWNLDDLE